MKTINLMKNINTQFGEVCIGCKNLTGSKNYMCSEGHTIISKDTPIKNNTPITYCTGCYELGKGLATNDWMF